MISNSVKINNVAVEVNGSIVAEMNRKGAVGYGSITVFSERAERYEPYSIVDLVCNGKTFQYVVQADEPHQEKNLSHEHVITLAEPILFFKTVFPADRSFTRETPMTIEQIFNIYKTELAFYQGLDIIMENYTDSIFDTKMPWKEYASKNFAVIMYDLFRRIDCIPRVRWDWLESSWIFSAEKINAKRNLITVDHDAADTAVNDVDYATTIKGQARNAMREEDPGIWFPSSDGWVTARAKGTLFKESELQFQFPHPIIQLKKAVAYVMCSMLLQGDSEFTDHVVEVDFTGSVLPKEVWETKSVDSLPNTKTRVTYDYLTDTYTYQYVAKQNLLYYEIGKTTIDNLFSQTQFIFFTENVLSLNHAIYYWVIKSANEQYDLYWDNPDHYTTVVVPYGGDYMDDADTELLKCRFQFVTERDFDFTSEKANVTGLVKSTVMNAQSENMIDSARYLESANALANRLGHPIQRREQLFAESQTPWNLGDYSSLGTIIDIRYAFDRYNTLVTADFAIGFSNTSGEYSISKEPEAFLIGRTRQRTNPIYSEYLLFSKEYHAKDSIFSDDAWDSLLNILQWYSANSKTIHHANFVPNPPESVIDYEAIDFLVFGSGSGNTIMMNITADHQTIAGYGKIKDGSAWYKNPVKYVDENDELVDMNIAFTEDMIMISDTATQEYYPEVQVMRSGQLTEGVTFPIDKNPNDNMGFTLQVICVSNSDDIIVGNGFAKYNNLIIDYAVKPATKVYVSQTPYSIFDKIIRTGDIEDTGAGHSISVNNHVIVSLSSAYAGYNWAIVYGNEILLAGNNSTYDIYTSLVKERI